MSIRIVVSAPKRDTVGGQLKGTGAVYICPVTPGNCVRSTHPRLYDVQGEQEWVWLFSNSAIA